MVYNKRKSSKKLHYNLKSIHRLQDQESMFPKKTSFMVRLLHTTPNITPLDSASQRSASLDLR